MEDRSSMDRVADHSTEQAMLPYPIVDFTKGPDWSRESAELLAVIVFGTTQNRGQLANGEVVRLDQRVDDPVELLVDGQLRARGNLIHDRGRTGIQITELIAWPSENTDVRQAEVLEHDAA